MAKNNKSFEDIMKEIEELNTAVKETNDAVSKFFEEVVNANNDNNEFGEKMKTYTDNRINEVAPWFSLAGVVPEAAPALAVGALGTTFLTALIDYGNDYFDEISQMPELAQAIYDYANEYKEKIMAAEEAIKNADEKKENAMNSWKKILDLVDKNGKLNDRKNIKELITAASLIEDYNDDIKIEIIGNQIQDYTNLAASIDNLIKEQNIKEKKDILRDISDEVYLNFDKVKTYYEKALEVKSDAFNNYEFVRDLRIATEKHQTPAGYDDYNFNVFLKAEKSAQNIADAVAMDYDAILELYDYYKKVDEMYKGLSVEEYKLTNPDYGKSPKQLDWETFAKRERERNMPGVGTKTNQQSPTTITAPAETPYSNNNQTIPNTVQNNILTPEMADTINSMPNAIIAEAAAIPELMREIGMQSLTAFTDGLLINKEYLEEAMDGLMNGAIAACEEIISSGMDDIVSAAVSSLDFHSIGYEKGSEFMDGFNASVSENDMNDIFNQLMAERSLAVSGMTAGQQMASFNYYENAPQQGSRSDEKIILENKADVKVVLDKDVIGKTVLEWTKEYQRRTGK